MHQPSREHVCLRTQCGICGQAMAAGEAFVPLMGGDGPSQPRQPRHVQEGTQPEPAVCLGTLVFPESNTAKTCETPTHGRVCWATRCWRCRQSPQAVALHADCLRLFRRECKAGDALGRLWTAAECKSPWPNAADLGLDADNGLDIGLVCEAADGLGIPGLRRLPPELVRAVRDHSEEGSSRFWGCVAAVSLGREMEAASRRGHPSLMTTSLARILEWTRGTEPTIVSHERLPSLVRLTIDCRGIKQAERLSHRPAYHPQRSDKVAYMMQEEDQLASGGPVRASFKYGALRLEMPDDMRGAHFWDMACPPALDDCRFYGHISRSNRFRTVDLPSATGVTFFFAASKLFAVHAHTPAAPDARSTFGRLSKQRQEKVTWVYLPLPKGEEVTALGLRLRKPEKWPTVQMPCFLVRTRLAGDVCLGPRHSSVQEDFMLSQTPPSLLIYNTSPDAVGPASVFGAYSQEVNADADAVFFPFPPARPGDAPLPQANLSTAPLRGVTRMQVLDDGETGLCNGVLLDYANGARRALGSCRLGVDAVKTYEKPLRLRHAAVEYVSGRPGPGGRRRAVRVEGGDLDVRVTAEDGEVWTSNMMEGVLEFWCSEEAAVIRVVGD